MEIGPAKTFERFGTGTPWIPNTDHTPAARTGAATLAAHGGRQMSPSLSENLQLLFPRGAPLHFQRGETIREEGDGADHVHAITGGTARMCRHTKSGRRQIIDFLFPGDVVGITQGPDYAFAVEAVNAVTLTAYSRAQIDRAEAQEASLRRQVVQHIRGDLAAAQQHLIVLGCQDAKEKVASFLIRMADRTGIAADGTIDLPMGRQDIADHLGITIETVCRTIGALKRGEFVACAGPHQLVLKNARGLRAMALNS
jgi:CRP-like cAMP-binding protein